MLWWRTLCLITLVYSFIDSIESLRWPAGTYGIPKPTSGCPLAAGFQWQKGVRSQDTNNGQSNNEKSPEFHLDAIVDKKKVQRSFCIKTITADDNNRPDWPPGQYCIYKKGPCPAKLSEGHVYWDDDDYWNNNYKSGTLPDGVYDRNTRIEFCCKTDGDKSDPVLLPSKSPFFLLAYKSEKCQMVKWATSSVEWIYYDTEHRNNEDGRGGAFPYDAGKEHPKIYYCYYFGCNKTLATVNGTFQSPNYPGKYPNGQHCSWRITVNTTRHIYLMFTTFSLQNEKNTDELYVYDGDSATGEVLGVFYGGHPPPEKGIYSSSNRMLIIFKSDKTDSYTGFSASYYGIHISAPSVATTQSPDETTPSFISPKTQPSEEPTSTTDEPSKKGGKKGAKEQPESKGVNVVAVVAPVVLVIVLASALVAGLFYYKRIRTNKEATANEVIFSTRSSDESPMSADNPYYDRNVVIANTDEQGFSEENKLYSEVKEQDGKDDAEPYMEHENENPLYEPAVSSEAVFNPIYDSST